MTTLDFKANCIGCKQETAGRLHFSDRMNVIDSDGGMLFEDGWTCHNCLGQPFSSSDVTL